MTAGGFDQIHDELRAVARDILGKAGAPARPGWRLLAEAGWLGLEVPGTLDGAEVTGLPAHAVLSKPASSGWESGAWLLDFIGSWEWTIPGGSSEIQRTIIAERGLGLPRGWR